MKIKNCLFLLILYFISLCYGVVFCTSTPTTLLVQANLHVKGVINYSGSIDIDIGIYEAFSDDPALWVESFENVNIINGSFMTVLGANQTDLYAELFQADGLRIGFTPYINGVSQGTEFIELKSVPYAFHSEIANQAERLSNEDTIYFDTVNNRVGINNTSPHIFDVSGTINATAFVGDGSGHNITISDDRLVWNLHSNGSDIYYSSGNVGIGIDSPSTLLEVSGNAIISGNLVVDEELTALYLKGDGSGITDLNADQITLGVLHSDRVSGSYVGITGVGTLTEGVWEGTEISDTYIAENLTISNGAIQGSNYISGNITLIGDTIITGNNF